MATTSFTPITPPLTISLDDARNKIGYWRADQNNIQNEISGNHPDVAQSPVLTSKAFTFFLKDFQQLLGRIDYWNSGENTGFSYEPSAPTIDNPINAVRLYPGNNIGILPGNNPIGRLFGVGVTGFSPDLNSGGDDTIGLTKGGTHIYNISHAGPPLSAENGIMSYGGEIPASSEYTISLADAQSRILNWGLDQATIKEYTTLDNSPIVITESVAFHLNELKLILKEIEDYNGVKASALPPVVIPNPINAIRFYFGKKIEQGIPVAPYACLIAVGVTGFNSAVEPTNGGDDVIQLPELPVIPVNNTLQSAIYDFSYPCPTTCPNPSKGIMDPTFS